MSSPPFSDSLPPSLPSPVVTALLESGSHEELAPEQSDALKLRIMQRIRSEAKAEVKSQVLSVSTDKTAIENKAAFTHTKRDDGWRRLHSKAQVKILHRDGVQFSWLLKLAAGGTLPAHTHEHGAEEVVMIEGTLLLNQVLYQAGDHHAAAAGSRHEALLSPDGCIAFLKSGIGFLPELERSLA
jgi:quercetin dioxygenase-like cupin family protein